MKSKYEQWISENINEATCRNTCRSATAAMQAFFPELECVRGHYVCAVGGSIPHWWCVDPDGEIVDPTVAQFPTRWGEYVPFTGPDPICKCMNCGELVWDREHSGACSPECAVELRREYEQAVRR